MADESAQCAPSTDCPTCGRSAKDCNAGKARGWDNCCQVCDERGHVVTHRLHAVSLPPGREA